MFFQSSSISIIKKIQTMKLILSQLRVGYVKTEKADDILFIKSIVNTILIHIIVMKCWDSK